MSLASPKVLPVVSFCPTSPLTGDCALAEDSSMVSGVARLRAGDLLVHVEHDDIHAAEAGQHEQRILRRIERTIGKHGQSTVLFLRPHQGLL